MDRLRGIGYNSPTERHDKSERGGLMDLQTARVLNGTRLQWPRLGALFLFAMAAALLLSSLAGAAGM